jgi:hypothetical protein
MVALPTPLKSLTDAVPEIKYMLRICAYHLYGWACEAEEVQSEAEMIKQGKIPEGYPTKWPQTKGGSAPPGLVTFDATIQKFIQRRKQKIKKDLRNAELGPYPFYPKEKVKEVLAFWQIEL